MTNEEARIELLEEYKIFLEGCGLENEEYLNQQMKDNDELRKVVEANRMAIKALTQQPCENCISRQEVLNILKDKWNMFSDANDAMQESIDTIEALSPITPQPKMGRWIDDKCSVCGKGIEDLIESSDWYENEKPYYCPFCGIKIQPYKVESEDEE